MLTQYIAKAMQKATYELLEDETFYGEIPDCVGVWAQANTLESCREDLQDALEGWILLGVRLGHQLPVINPDKSLNFCFNEDTANCVLMTDKSL